MFFHSGRAHYGKDDEDNSQEEGEKYIAHLAHDRDNNIRILMTATLILTISLEFESVLHFTDPAWSQH